MRNMHCSCLLLPALLAALSAYGESWYAQAPRVKVMTRPSLNAPVAAEAEKGQRFEAEGRQGNWLKVRFKSKEGYVSVFSVAQTPPGEKQAGLRSREETGVVGARSRASSAAAAVAGFKGLTYEDRARGSRDEMADWKALGKMEALSPSEEELRRFLKERK